MASMFLGDPAVHASVDVLDADIVAAVVVGRRLYQDDIGHGSHSVHGSRIHMRDHPSWEIDLFGWSVSRGPVIEDSFPVQNKIGLSLAFVILQAGPVPSVDAHYLEPERAVQFVQPSFLSPALDHVLDIAKWKHPDPRCHRL